MKSDKAPCIIYVDHEFLIEKIDSCKNNPEKSSITKIGENIPCWYSMSTICPFDSLKNKYSFYEREHAAENIIEHAADVINFKKKSMLPLTEKRTKVAPRSNTWYYICRKKFSQKLGKDKNHQNDRDHCHFIRKYRGAAHSICNLRFNVPNNILIVFHNRSKYDYHFIMKELANELKGKFECWGEITEKYKIFAIWTEKEIKKIDKDHNEYITTVSYKIKFVDSARFMAGSLSNLVNNLVEGIDKIKCKDCNCFLEYKSVNGILIKYESLSCNKNYSNKIIEKLKSGSRIDLSFLITVLISLCCCR